MFWGKMLPNVMCAPTTATGAQFLLHQLQFALAAVAAPAVLLLGRAAPRLLSIFLFFFFFFRLSPWPLLRRGLALRSGGCECSEGGEV